MLIRNQDAPPVEFTNDTLIVGTGITLEDDGTGLPVLTASGATTGLYDPNTPPITPNAMDDEFQSASLDAKWTTWNWGPGPMLDEDYNEHGTYLKLQFPNAATFTGSYLTQPLPSAPWTFRLRVAFDESIGTSVYANVGVGVCLVESATNKGMIIGPGRDSSSDILWHNFGFSNVYDIVADSPISGPGNLMQGFVTIQCTFDGTAYQFHGSRDGTNFQYLLTGTGNFSGRFTTAPDSIGIGFYRPIGSPVYRADWFRRMA